MKQFTRDEAIAIVMANQRCADVVPYNQAARLVLRAALVALADAGVFGDVPSPEQGPSQTMRDLLDAAGIR